MTDEELNYVESRLYRGFGVEVRPCRDYSSAEDGRWVFTPDSTIWRRASTRYYKTRTQVPGGRSGHAQAINRAVQSTELDRCLPELFPSHNFCNKDGRCPQRLLTPSVRLVRWL
jgi:hypothetical protein